jgi:DNA-binding IclR family transcriptional regulator
LSRPALAASRAIDILNFMAASPLRRYSLTELVRALRLNPASCHALVGAMTRDGYLVRHMPGKNYQLGPALIAIGHGALQCHPIVAAARDRIIAISREADLDCLLTAQVGDRLIALATEGPGRASGLRIGQRVPLIPPLGTAFIAWAGPAEAEKWLQMAADEEERVRLRESLAAVRARGYAVTLRGPRQNEAGLAVLGLADAPFEDERQERAAQLLARMGEDYLMIEARSDRFYPVDLISAPVFAADGTVACTISLYGFDRPLSPSRLASLGRELQRHSRAVNEAFAATQNPVPDETVGDAECAR